MESIIAWNAPATHKADAWITDALNKFFDKKQHKGWRFFSVDKNRNMAAGARITSKVIDRHLAMSSKMGFME